MERGFYFYFMPSETGIWTKDEASVNHDFSYKLAKFIGEYLPKDEMLLDIGCGLAQYLRYFHDIGFKKLLGYEGEQQHFEYGNVKIQDFTQSYNPLYTGNVLCLEVGEHIPPQYLSTFLDNICNTVEDGKKLIYSHAIPGQDGVGHVSCKHNIWVINQMEIRGMSLLVDDSLEMRQHVEDRLHYFRNTLLIFTKYAKNHLQ